MHSRTSLISLFLIFMVGFSSAVFAEQAADLSEKSASAAEVNEVAVPAFPYIAEITGNNVNIRSGPGTNYYGCGKLNKADRVKIVGSQFSWSRIVPPSGSFSWISKQYIKVEPDNPGAGVVTGNGVRVYAGSESVKPIHSTTVQLKFNQGDKVKLLGPVAGDYYKIAPPVGTYLWVTTKFTKPLGGVGEVPLTTTVRRQSEPEPQPTALAPTSIPVESEMLNKYYALEKKVNSEQTKPIAEQNYDAIKEAFQQIADNKDAGKAARYAKFAVKKIGRFELAQVVGKEVVLLDKQLQQTKQRIDKARLTKLAEFKDISPYDVVGRFQTSSIYSSDVQALRYRITDKSGKTLCYAIPADSAKDLDLSNFADKTVGLRGAIEPHPQTGSALIRFTEIVSIE